MNTLCQLAGTYRPSLPRHGAMVEEKFDGWRAVYAPDDLGRPALWTRLGVPLMGASHILGQLQRIEAAMGGRWMIDGEYQVDGTLAATKAHCERGWRQGDAGLFHAFDAVPLDQWRRGGTDTPLYRRKAALVEAIGATAPDADAWEWEAGSRGRNHGKPCVIAVPDQWCANDDDLAAMATKIWAAGGEGMMIKCADSPYRRKRSNDWRKLKCPSQLSRAA